MNPKVAKEVNGQYLMSSGAVLLFAIESSEGADRPECGKARAREIASKLFGLARTYGDFHQEDVLRSLFARDGWSDRVVDTAQSALRGVPTAELVRALSNVGKLAQ
ncbi:hypothetical protein [Paraburkholderia ginsengisoli]|uniref:Uncharacterized protein n=1 Tax=Paraburkholderia ginsengisoli TaxID=311231 RepID=A0A7T4N248_9BURK|nr:hypothetical protein [Paraburkholderia ginsengisoli]QQC63868.1 hypothetical protein I6I06_16515 [Paraburkholderia ginsengisoli]